MATGRRHHTDLRIVELAVDPADVDRDTYPVTDPADAPADGVRGLGARCHGAGRSAPRATRSSSPTRGSTTWRGSATPGPARLERVQSRAEELEGETLVADSRRVDEQARHGSHLRSQQVDDRGLH